MDKHGFASSTSTTCISLSLAASLFRSIFIDQFVFVRWHSQGGECRVCTNCITDHLFRWAVLFFIFHGQSHYRLLMLSSTLILVSSHTKLVCRWPEPYCMMAQNGLHLIIFTAKFSNQHSISAPILQYMYKMHSLRPVMWTCLLTR